MSKKFEGNLVFSIQSRISQGKVCLSNEINIYHKIPLFFQQSLEYEYYIN